MYSSTTFQFVYSKENIQIVRDSAKELKKVQESSYFKQEVKDRFLQVNGIEIY